MIPGNRSSPCRIFWIRFLRISSLTESTLYPLARNSPIVRALVVMVIRVILLPFLGVASRHVSTGNRGATISGQPSHDCHLRRTGGTYCHSTPCQSKAQELSMG